MFQAYALILKWESISFTQLPLPAKSFKTKRVQPNLTNSLFMKNLFFTLLALIAFTTVFSCKKDKNEPNSYEFSYDGNKYKLTSGFLTEYGTNGNGSYDWDVYLTSDGIAKEGFRDLTGKGDFIFLDLNSSSSTGLTTGTYTWSTFRDASTITTGFIGLDYDVDNPNGVPLIPATDGTVTIDINGTETTITFSLIMDSGKTVSGEWKGMLQTL